MCHCFTFGRRDTYTRIKQLIKIARETECAYKNSWTTACLLYTYASKWRGRYCTATATEICINFLYTQVNISR